MAKKVIKTKYRCRDCKHSYDYQHVNAKGELFMCRCPFFKDGKLIKFLKDNQCEHFKHKGLI